mgnify:CR=1 FL=1
MNRYQESFDRLAFNFGLDCLDEKLYPEEIEDFKLFKKLVDKETPVTLEYEGDGYDGKGNMIYDTAICPVCERHFEVDYDEHSNYCPNCGQRLDWGDDDE